MPTDAPLITTIIPTYRRPQLLKRAIRSALNQTFPHLQVCVYDNASGDETAAVVAELACEDSRVTYYCQAENIGANANFVFGMERVDTPFFAMLSDDDYYLPTFYETAMTGFDNHPTAMCSGGATIFITERGRISRPSSAEGYFVPPDDLGECIAGTYPAVTGFVFRTEVIEQIGVWDSTILHADIDYLWRVFSQFPHVVSRRPCVMIFLHEHQQSRSVDLDVWLRGYEVVRGNLTENRALSPVIQMRAIKKVAAMFARSFFSIGLFATATHDLIRIRQAANILRTHFHMTGRAFVLDTLAAVCQRGRIFSWVFYRLLVSLQFIVLRFHARKHDALRTQIQMYLPTS